MSVQSIIKENKVQIVPTMRNSKRVEQLDKATCATLP